MTQLHLKVVSEATPDQVWDRISDFYSIHTWQPLMTATTPDPEHANARRMTLADGGTAVEQLIEQTGRSCRYRLLSGPVPVRDYEAVLAVHDNPHGTGALITWDATFEPEGADEDTAVAVMTGILQTGLDALAR
ncbi:SRPBCC family protein [Streptomyces sp. PRKS01-29]|nr:SRPBCC family protein [Streptomyces sabulosicollis]MBI0293954.1 SRPBCC family protein [Streptomyces sabulosicollis]